jgi:ArsR family transcriptional regulator
MLKGRSGGVQTKTARERARLLRIVAHPTRLMILDELAQGMKCVNDIRELLEIPQPNVSQHLAVLKRSGLVVCHKDGVTRCYHLAKPGLVKDLFAVLGGDYPTAKVGAPERCRAARNAPRRAHSTRRKRAIARA